MNWKRKIQKQKQQQQQQLSQNDMDSHTKNWNQEMVTLFSKVRVWCKENYYDIQFVEVIS